METWVVPYTAFTLRHMRVVGKQLFHLVSGNHELLEGRGLLSATSALARCEEGELMATAAALSGCAYDVAWLLTHPRLANDKVGSAHYAIVRGSSDPLRNGGTDMIGAARIRRPRSEPGMRYSAIEAWTDWPSDPEHEFFGEALQILAREAVAQAVTFEPMASPVSVHEAIKTAGFAALPGDESSKHAQATTIQYVFTGIRQSTG